MNNLSVSRNFCTLTTCLILIGVQSVLPHSAYSETSADGVLFRINPIQLGDQGEPRISMTPNGAFAVVWESADPDESHDAVFARFYDASGTPLTGEFELQAGSSLDRREPAVAVNRNTGDIVIVWESRSPVGSDESWDVFAQVFGPDGTPLTQVIAVNANTANQQKNAEVAVDPASGNFVVVWQSLVREDFDVYVRRFDASGAALGSEERVNANAEGNHFDPAVATDDSGGFAVVWESDPGADSDIWMRIFNAQGVAVGSEANLNTKNTGEQSDPHVAVTGEGEIVVVWESDHTGTLGIFAQRFDSSGAPQGGEFSADSSLYGNNPRVAMNGNGDFSIVWEGQPIGNNEFTWGRNFDSNGSALGETFLMGGVSDQGAADVALSADGNLFVAVWEGAEVVGQSNVYGWLSETSLPPEFEIPEGLVAYYKLDGDGLDSSGNEKHALAIAADETDDARFGGAYSFNGIDQSIEIPSPFSGTQSEFTIEMWIDVDGNSAEGAGIFSHVTRSNASGLLSHFGIGADSSRPFVNQVFSDAGDAFVFARIDGISYAVGGWRHLAVTADSTGVRVFQDGQLVSLGRDFTWPHLWTGGEETSVRLGMGHSGVESWLTSPFAGSIDEVRFWDHVRTQVQIEDLMDITLNTPEVPIPQPTPTPAPTPDPDAFEIEAVADGFQVGILSPLQRELSLWGNSIVAGANGDFLAVETRSDLRDYIVWYTGAATMDAARTGSGIHVRGIASAGPNAVLIAIENPHEDRWAVYRLSGSFNPVAVEEFAKH